MNILYFKMEGVLSSASGSPTRTDAEPTGPHITYRTLPWPGCATLFYVFFGLVAPALFYVLPLCETGTGRPR
jgi:hypothetical protein